VSLSDLRQMIQLEVDRLSTAKPPVIEYVEKVPELKPESTGNGTFIVDNLSFPFSVHMIISD